MTAREAESAVLVPCPRADRVVQAWRTRLDPSCGLGVPAHVTLLYPFVSPPDIDAAVLRRLEAVAGGVQVFEFSLAAVRWFRDQAVYLAPEPVEPFQRLTGALVESFPGYPPYGGIHDSVVHHLTVGDGADITDMRRAATALEGALPIRETASNLHLMVGSDEPGSWRVVARLPLSLSPPDRSSVP
jgi:hypothetical protein